MGCMSSSGQGWPGVLSSRNPHRPGLRAAMLTSRHTCPALAHVGEASYRHRAAAVLLPLTAPVLLAAAICIRLEDKGPVLYRHAVIGRYGVQTEVLKLRTMVPNAPDARSHRGDELSGGLLRATTRIRRHPDARALRVARG